MNIIRMAQEAGFATSWTEAAWNALERFASLVAAAEREECAKVCDNLIMYGPVAEVQQRYNKAYADCRDKIRERGVK